MMKGGEQMPVCQHCQEQWTWKETIRQSFTLDISMTCPHCQEKQYVSKSYRAIGHLFLFSPILLFFIVLWLDISLINAIILSIILALIVFSLYPFMIKLSNEEEPFW